MADTPSVRLLGALFLQTLEREIAETNVTFNTAMDAQYDALAALIDQRIATAIANLPDQGGGGTTPVVAPTLAAAPVASATNLNPGGVFTCTQGTWNNNPTTFTYRAIRVVAAGSPGTAGVPQTGYLASPSYTFVTADVGFDYYWEVAASNSAGSLIAYTPTALTVASPSASPPVNTQPATMVRRPSSDVFDISVGVWTNSPTKYYVTVLRNGSAVGTATQLTGGTTTTTYTAVPADVGQILSVSVFGENAATATGGVAGEFSGGVFVEPLVSTSSGSLSVGITTSSSTANLTTIGVVDWIKWNNAAIERKSTGGSAISYTYLSGGIDQSTTSIPTCSWTDGTPTASGSSAVVGRASAWQTTGSGIRITTAIGTAVRVVDLWITDFDNTYEVTASLSDGSAASYSSGSLDSGVSTSINRRIQVTASAGSASQTLTIEVKTHSTRPNGNIGFVAAAIES